MNTQGIKIKNNKKDKKDACDVFQINTLLVCVIDVCIYSKNEQDFFGRKPLT